MDILSAHKAEVAEQAYAHDSKSCSERNVGSIPTFGTKIITQAPINNGGQRFNVNKPSMLTLRPVSVYLGNP